MRKYPIPVAETGRNVTAKNNEIFGKRQCGCVNVGHDPTKPALRKRKAYMAHSTIARLPPTKHKSVAEKTVTTAPDINFRWRGAPCVGDIRENKSRRGKSQLLIVLD